MSLLNGPNAHLPLDLLIAGSLATCERVCVSKNKIIGHSHATIWWRIMPDNYTGSKNRRRTERKVCGARCWSFAGEARRERASICDARDYIECNGHLFQRSDFRALFASAAWDAHGANSVLILLEKCVSLPAIEEETCDIKCETLHEKKTHKLSRLASDGGYPIWIIYRIYMSASPETSFYFEH